MVALQAEQNRIYFHAWVRQENVAEIPTAVSTSWTPPASNSWS